VRVLQSPTHGACVHLRRDVPIPLAVDGAPQQDLAAADPPEHFNTFGAAVVLGVFAGLDVPWSQLVAQTAVRATASKLGGVATGLPIQVNLEMLDVDVHVNVT